MSGFSEWVRRKRFATAGHVGMLDRRLDQLATEADARATEADARATEADARATAQAANIEAQLVELTRLTADTREASNYTRRAIELGVPAGLSSGSHSRPTAENWFESHYWQAADQILSFIAAAGLGIGGKDVADVGSGDGVIDLALATRGPPASLVGYDVTTTDADALLKVAADAGIEELPANLSFEQSGYETIPAADSSVDVVVTWSTFEHVSEPLAMFKEIRRIMRPTGALMLQIWPLYYSDHGAHLWLTHGGGFPHLTAADEQLLADLKGKVGTDARRPADDEYLSLNRLTLDELNELLLAADMKVARAELLSETVNIPPQVEGVPLSDLLISGIKLLAVPS